MLEGYKTYVVGAAALFYGTAILVFPDAGLPGDGPTLIGIGLTALGLRRGMKTGAR